MKIPKPTLGCIVEINVDHDPTPGIVLQADGQYVTVRVFSDDEDNRGNVCYALAYNADGVKPSWRYPPRSDEEIEVPS